MSTLRIENGRLVREHDGEILWIEAWGTDSLRIRASCRAAIDPMAPGALLPATPSQADIVLDGENASYRNGNIVATLRDQGRLTISDVTGKVLVAERWRNREVAGATYSALNTAGREFKPLMGDMYRVTLRLEAVDGEKLFGMGQYQDGRLDLKGSVLELAQRNSQASVPFLMSNRGYGLLWNNPAVGRASLAGPCR